MIHPAYFDIALSLVEGVGPIKAKQLIQFCGSAEAVFSEKKQVLLKIPDVGEKLVNAIYGHNVFRRVEKELLFTERERIDVLTYKDSRYPRRLLHCPDHPIVLFSKGKVDTNVAKVLSIVGTRKVTPQGKSICDEIVLGIADQNILVVSGMAYGVDITAHRSSIKHGLSTIGVLGHGLDRMYPRDHESTGNKMMENGGLLTEFLSETNPDRENFPMRNRIVAGMSDAILVIESLKTGGAMITANLAVGYNRDVFAVPGRPSDTFSGGCNELISSNRGALVSSANDVLKAMGWEKITRPKAIQRQLMVELDEDESLIVEELKKHMQLSIDELGVALGKSVSQLAVPLLQLELKGVIESLSGKRYRSL